MIIRIVWLTLVLSIVWLDCARTDTDEDAEEDEDESGDMEADLFDDGAPLVIADVNMIRRGSQLLCSACSSRLARRDDIVSVESSVALSAENLTVWSAAAPMLIQRFSNGAQEFQLFTVLRTRAVPVTRPSGAQTWWPGFEWSVLQCPVCSTHVGWHFTPTNRSSQFQFAALNVDVIDVLDDLLEVHDE
jgi:hypothetical protein